MKSTKSFHLKYLFLSLALLSISLFSSANGENTNSTSLDQILQWRNHQKHNLSNPNSNTITAWIISFLAASISSAGGVGGGSLYIPILTLVSGFDLKIATAFCAFMVTGGTLSNVLYTLLFVDKSLVNYDIALLSQPCMLLGVSIGVICNLMFPAWLISTLFVVFLACTTVKTSQSGLKFWKKETEKEKRIIDRRESESGVSVEPLLGEGGERKELGFPWKDVLVLVVIWLCFFVLHFILGDQYGKGVVNIEPCGVVYWLITACQIPFAIAFTFHILHLKKKPLPENHQHGDDEKDVTKRKIDALPGYVFPFAALLTGVMSGLFGIGGGLLLNPVFLHIGVPPQTASATTTFMVLFSASMSMVQYTLLGVSAINEALIYATICFVASIVGLALLQRAVRQSGRASLVVFMVCVVMALSLVVIALFGAIDVWKQIKSGEYMGFKLPC
ncbi:hypothetical protein LUZ60_016320 [Juncus effusus]|nr:hypothetical protein LUZ60_016320 [Juncus effusus]